MSWFVRSKAQNIWFFNEIWQKTANYLILEVADICIFSLVLLEKWQNSCWLFLCLTNWLISESFQLQIKVLSDSSVYFLSVFSDWWGSDLVQHLIIQIKWDDTYFYFVKYSSPEALTALRLMGCVVIKHYSVCKVVVYLVNVCVRRRKYLKSPENSAEVKLQLLWTLLFSTCREQTLWTFPQNIRFYIFLLITVHPPHSQIHPNNTLTLLQFRVVFSPGLNPVQQPIVYFLQQPREAC